MKLPVTSLDNKKVGEIDLADEVFGLPVRRGTLKADHRRTNDEQTASLGKRIRNFSCHVVESHAQQFHLRGPRG